MVENENTSEKNDPLRSRRERMGGGPGSKRVPWVRILFFVVLVMVAVFVIFPEQTRRFFGLGTSTSKDLQQTSRTDSSGISTSMERKTTIDTESRRERVLATSPPPAKDAKLDPEAAARLAALEKALQEIADRPSTEPGPTADDIENLLDQQAAGFRAEAETREKLLRAQLDALTARTKMPTGPTAEELARAELLRRQAEQRAKLKARLEKARADRKAELLARRVSDGNVYDESEEGKSTSGPAEDETGIRELSDNEKFLKSSASQGFKTAKANSLGDISKLIVQGTVISAILETAINTELPGNIRAQVTTPVYSFDGKDILMPAGTRLIGTYNSKISIAQKRVLIAWNRAITPDGKSVKLAATGTDRLGKAGQKGNVDTRFFQRFGTAILITSISAIPSFLANDDATGSSNSNKAATNVAKDASDDLKDTTEKVLEDYLSLKPIIRIPQGTIMNILVNQDLDFS